MGEQRTPRGSFDGALGVADECYFDNFGRASESEGELGGSESNRGEERGFSKPIEAARILPTTDGQVGGREAGDANLAAVAMSRQLERHFAGGCGEVGSIGFVGEEEGESFGWDVFQRLVDVERSEEGVGSGHVEGMVIDGEGLGPVFEKVDAVFGEVFFDEGPGLAYVMISIDGEGTESGFDLCEDRCEVLDGGGSTVDEVTGECDDVGVEVGGGFCGA